MGTPPIVALIAPLKRHLRVQCVVRVDPDTGKREVAGTHWDFNSYGGELKKAMGIAPQVRAGFCLLYLQTACQSSPVCFYLSCSCWILVTFGGRSECQELHPAATWCEHTQGERPRANSPCQQCTLMLEAGRLEGECCLLLMANCEQLRCRCLMSLWPLSWTACVYGSSSFPITQLVRQESLS